MANCEETIISTVS